LALRNAILRGKEQGANEIANLLRARAAQLYSGAAEVMLATEEQIRGALGVRDHPPAPNPQA
jgi:hypothetical protein